MAEALEEKATIELIKRDEAIEALQSELEKIEAEKEQLAGDAAEATELRKAVEGYMAEAKLLKDKLQASVSAHEATKKDVEAAESRAKDLGEKLESEENNNRTLSAEVKALHGKLDGAASLGLSSAEAYKSALAEFGGVTTALPEDLSASALFGWFKENIAKLPAFVGGAVDYGAMSCGNNLYRLLEKAGCKHIPGVLEAKRFESPEELGNPSETPKGVKNFIKYFWQKFGRSNARLLAETRLAAVSVSSLLCLVVWLLLSYGVLFTFCLDSVG